MALGQRVSTANRGGGALGTRSGGGIGGGWTVRIAPIITRVRGWQKQDAAAPTDAAATDADTTARDRIPQPAPQNHAAHREGRFERGLVVADAATAGRGLRENQQPHDRPAPPPEPLRRDRPSVARLLVELPNRLLDRRELRFHLDDEQHQGPGFECEQVDRPALAVDRVRDLDLHEPAGNTQPPHRRLDERRMPAIHEPIERTASPSDVELGTRVEGLEQGTDRPQRQPVEPTALDERDRRLADARERPESLLGQATSTSESAERAPDLHVAHRKEDGSGRFTADYSSADGRRLRAGDPEGRRSRAAGRTRPMRGRRARRGGAPRDGRTAARARIAGGREWRDGRRSPDAPVARRGSAAHTGSRATSRASAIPS
jgi:hypothetical protein